MYVLRAVHVSYNKLDHIGVHEEAEERRLARNQSWLRGLLFGLFTVKFLIALTKYLKKNSILYIFRARTKD
jgi:hypothetical protein